MAVTDTERLAGLLRSAERILIFTGAGVSTGSGIPDYRGPAGVWKTRTPVTIQEFLGSEAGRIEYWEWKMDSWPTLRDAQPNAVHRAAVALEETGKLLAVVTQNVDGLDSKAGTSPERLVEIHGTDRAVSCLRCGDRREPGPCFEEFAKSRKPPICDCGGFLKPATISFGQGLREDDLARAFGAAAQADMAISLGSTLAVTPAALVPMEAARRGAPYAIVNRGETAHDGLPYVTLRIDDDVGAVFPEAVRLALVVGGGSGTR